MRKIFSDVFVVCLLLGVSAPSIVTETELNKIVLRNEDGIKLSIVHESEESHSIWKIHYENMQEAGRITSLRVDNQDVHFKFEANEDWIEQEDNWITVSSNTLKESRWDLVTPNDVTSLTIEMMLDSDFTQTK